MELQGISNDKLESKLEFYRQALGEKLGAADLTANGISVTAMVPQIHANGLMVITERLLQGQQEQVVDQLFEDIQTLEQATARLHLIRALLQEIDDGPDFRGKNAARAALADLSIEVKKIKF